MEREFHIRFDLTVRAEDENAAYEVADQLRDIPYVIPSALRMRMVSVSLENPADSLSPIQMLEREAQEETGLLAIQAKMQSLYGEVDAALVGNGHTLTSEERVKLSNLFRFSFIAQGKQLSQRDFAKDFKVSEQTVSRWARGIAVPNRNQFDRLATHFGWSRGDK